jgi:CBS domain-containing protein
VSTLRVRELMTPDVVTISPKASIQALQDLMNDKFIRHVPVVDDEGTILGLVSDRDLLRQTMGVDLTLPVSARREALDAVRVADIMTQDVETVDVDAPVAQAAALMLENKFGCVPVLEEGLLAGILTEADFVRFVADGQTVSES